MKNLTAIIILIILFTSCRQKLSKENLMSVYRIGWNNGYIEGIKNHDYKWVESQRKIDESLFYLDFYAISESLPTQGGFKTNKLPRDRQTYYEFNNIPIPSCIRDTVITYHTKDSLQQCEYDIMIHYNDNGMRIQIKKWNGLN